MPQQPWPRKGLTQTLPERMSNSVGNPLVEMRMEAKADENIYGAYLGQKTPPLGHQ